MNIAGAMPPAFRNHRAPTAWGTPAEAAASSLDAPAAIAAQNSLRSSRPATGGRPSDGKGLRPEQSDRRLRVVIATSIVEVLRRPLESALAPTIAVVNEPATPDRTTLMQSLFQGIEDKARMSRARHPPANDTPGIGINHKGDVDKAGPGRDICEVRHPEHVRPRRLELPVHPIGRARRRTIADRGLCRLAADDALQVHPMH
jgi:hypothetical protein